ncbi:uncharacterized protein [Miscanthus floridulus]|uniref:uncharacterized protein n=1 Tax=Miscanthus floridulus TaxID=154761 RepID=UPI0034581F9C
MPYALRRLFSTILVHCEATKIRALWEKHKESVSEDYNRNRCNSKIVEQMVLRDIRDLLQSMGKDIKNYDLLELNDTDDCVNKLIQHVFPSLGDNARSTSYMSTRAILSTKNEHVDQLNEKMIDRFPGEEKVYHSFDSVNDDSINNYPIDFLNSITPNGLPPHVLKVKINCPVILLRNLDPNNGLCNGTRLMVKALQDNAIDVEIVGGQHAGRRVFLPRIPMSPFDDISLPFKMRRK